METVIDSGGAEGADSRTVNGEMQDSAMMVADADLEDGSFHNSISRLVDFHFGIWPIRCIHLSRWRQVESHVPSRGHEFQQIEGLAIVGALHGQELAMENNGHAQDHAESGSPTDQVSWFLLTGTDSAKFRG